MLLPRAMKATTIDAVEVVWSCLSEVCLSVAAGISRVGSLVGISSTGVEFLVGVTGVELLVGVPQLIQISSECSSSLVSV